MCDATHGGYDCRAPIPGGTGSCRMSLFTQARLTALVALAFCGSAQADDIAGAGSTFVFPILSKWSDEYGAKTGTKLDYQADRLGPGHRANQGSGGRFRRIRCTVEAGGSPEIGSRAVPAGDRRHRAGREYRRREARRDQVHRCAPCRHLSRQGEKMERSGDREAQPRRRAAGGSDCRAASLRQLGNDVQLGQLSLEGQPGMARQGG